MNNCKTLTRDLKPKFKLRRVYSPNTSLGLIVLWLIFAGSTVFPLCAYGQINDSEAFLRSQSAYRGLVKKDSKVKSLRKWTVVANQLNRFLDEFPQSKHIPQALYLLGRLNERMFRGRDYVEGLSRAIYYYERLAKSYKGHRLVDDALLYLGDLRRQALQDDVAARAAYYEIIDVYPKGDQVKLARRRLRLISGKALKVKKSVKTIARAEKVEKIKADLELLERQKAKEQSGELPSENQTEVLRAEDLTLDLKEGRGKQLFKKLSGINARPLIVIDPGHGGEDEGAHGHNGVLEKNIVLQISFFLKSILEERLRVKVLLTRESDVSLPLQDRILFANEHKADLFISVHANASPRKNLKGIETYYLDNTNDRSSLKLAERENASYQGKVSDLQFILSDLIQNAKLEDSVLLAHHLESSLVTTLSRYYHGVKELGVKKAPFFVLVGAHMPCSLVEVSFIDHPIEGKRLITRKYQKLIAQALYEGVRDYFAKKEKK